MLYQQIFENRISNLKSKKMLLAKELEEFPKGSLECNKDGDRYRWYVYVDKQRKALSKRKDQELAAQFLNKMQLQCELDAVSAEIIAMDAYNKHLSGVDRYEEFFEKMQKPAYQDLLEWLGRSYKKKTKLDSAEWEKAPFVQNQEHPENKIYHTTHGDLVRSKSEMMISLLLSQHNIPFHYEEELVLDNITLYPDFTIMHPISLKKVYWEHLGMLNSESYYQVTTKKIHTYIENGIFPGDNLILTCEDLNHPLDIEMVNNVIGIFFQ